MTDHPLLYKPDPSNRIRMEITPESAGWDFLSFAVLHLEAGDTHDHLLADEETALVPLSGSATVRVGDIETTISRSSVFDEMPRIAYAPPGTPIAVVAGDDHFEFAQIGSAPAEGRYAARIIEPAEMTSVLRGGGSAYRQVNNVLAPPVDAERLILYEVYVSRYVVAVGRRIATTGSTTRRTWRRPTISGSTRRTATASIATGAPTRTTRTSSPPETASARS